MRTQISFKKFNPNKPVNYVMLSKSIIASIYPHTFTSFAYSGKPRSFDPSNSPQCMYYVREIEKSVKRMVNNLVRYNDLSDQNLTFTRLYTSVYLSNWLREQQDYFRWNFSIQSKRHPHAKQTNKQAKDREQNSGEIY